MAASGSDEIHQTIIRDHFRRPRNRGEPDGSHGDRARPDNANGGGGRRREATGTGVTGTGRAHNRFCGDTVIMWAQVKAGCLAKVGFDGRGCAISQAAASMLTVVAKGVSVDDVASIRQSFVDGLAPDGPPLPKKLGDLRALVGVRRFPSRVRCAVLPFEALEEAVEMATGDRAPRSGGTEG